MDYILQGYTLKPYWVIDYDKFDGWQGECKNIGSWNFTENFNKQPSQS